MQIPQFVREVVEEIAFQARQDQKIDKRSGVSQRLPISLLENVVSNAERRAILAGETGHRPAGHRHLRGAAGDHRQVRARIRRRAARRRQRRARHHPGRRRQRVRRLLRRRRSRAGDGLVRPRRHPADRRHAVGGGAAGTGGSVQGLQELATQAGVPEGSRHAARRIGGRFRARRALRAEEDQPLGRVPVSRRRTSASSRHGRCRQSRCSIGMFSYRGARRSITTRNDECGMTNDE